MPVSRIRFSTRARRSAKLGGAVALVSDGAIPEFEMSIYCVHAANSTAAPAMKASRATIGDALREAKLLLNGGAAFVWIADGNGKLILPADQVRARLDQSASAPQNFPL
jgi:hypothetical protein